jgi:hypothetical protein
VVGQFRALAEWLGPEGRALTTAKNIRPADARELVTLLGTGEEGLKFRSAAELPGLMGLRGQADNDVEHTFDAFETLGAVTSARGMADAVFSRDLDGEDGPFGYGEAAELRRQLAGPVQLVSLIWNLPHLRRIPVACEHHHNDHRPHMAPSSAAPLKPLPAEVTDLEAFQVRRRDRVGGVIHEYQHAAPVRLRGEVTRRGHGHLPTCDGRLYLKLYAPGPARRRPHPSPAGTRRPA